MQTAENNTQSKSYTYNLFSPGLIATGYLFIGIAVTLLCLALFTSASEEPYGYLSIAFMLTGIGLIIVSTSSTITVVEEPMEVLLESRMFGMVTSNKRVKIPTGCKGLLIKITTKRSVSRFNAVLPVTSTFKSFDMFFYTDTRVVRLINTDYDRAIEIAIFIKEQLGIDYVVK